MNGPFNMNFMMTFILGRNKTDTRNNLLMAMTAGQSANYMAPILLKLGPIDTITKLTEENTNLKSENTALQGSQADLAACKAALTDCQAKLQACLDGSELKICQANLTACQELLEASRAELNACKLELADCNKKLTGCGKVVGNCDEINRIMNQVKDKPYEDLIKAENKKIIQDIITLAGKIIPSTG